MLNNCVCLTHLPEFKGFAPYRVTGAVLGALSVHVVSMVIPFGGRC